ncbi:ABC transporter permease [Caenimonas aquaedulcis]|uniref:Transport permease protein n=1 Tax=Caenimonas aquaedulcis TaxID=2793270 RepID=A0A931H7F4_9BURK|nr:ABC transporter permease [Caenimonas aquaedulcis]MBG9389783.1 ABC transporter permease [Caenimonas aquaedulcis]
MLTRLLHRGHPLFLARHRYLVAQLVRRDIMSRYQGSVLGIGWSLLSPLLILAAYTFVFRSVFKARWPGGSDSTSEFVLQLFAGLLIFNLFADLLGRAPRVVLDQPNLVKRVVFPLEVLSWVAVGAAMFQAVLALAILLGAAVGFGTHLTAWILAAPLVLASMVPFLLGTAWLLSSVGVFLRDITHAIGPAVSMLLFASPVLYPVQALPPFFARILWLNPLTVPIESLRRIVLHGTAPDWQALGAYTAIGLVFAFLAYRLFERLRPAFADEI